MAMTVQPDEASLARAVPAPPAPLGLLAELTHRCPLACGYCSNPVELERRSVELSTETWMRVFEEARALGVLQVHLSGGEPTARRDIVALTAHAARLGLYTNLITSAAGVKPELLAALIEAGLDHVQLSVQGADAPTCDTVTGRAGSFEEKKRFAAWVIAQDVPLTVNAVFHRGNIGQTQAMCDLALAWGARRVEIAHVQYYGWAVRNRAALMPKRADVFAAMAEVDRLRVALKGRLVIDAVVPDYYAQRPKACMGGWGQRTLNVTPSGKVLPCHAAETIPGLVFWSVADRSLASVWLDSPAFRAYRGEDWREEPCISCAAKSACRGGCRCQALLVAGRAEAADPACALSPAHAAMLALAEADADAHVPVDPRRFL
jgi:pyrroloquinoline quinone biosynthesis protein E